MTSTISYFATLATRKRKYQNKYPSNEWPRSKLLWSCSSLSLTFVQKIIQKLTTKFTPKRPPKIDLKIALSFVQVTTFLVTRVLKRHLQQPNFSNGLTKLAILPDYKCPGMLCLALPALRKVRKLDFQREFFLCQKSSEYLWNFFHWRIISKARIFC